jgi:histone acetyltransferase (RNA polymerase elongator complex component)
MIIPFFIPHSGCPHQCVFCNQKNITGLNHPEAASAIPDKINCYICTNNAQTPVEIAFYGGSFTALPLEVQGTYLEAVRPFIESGRAHGLRLSTRPDCISNHILSFLKEHLVTVIELGAQSMDDKVLNRSGRGHRAEDTINAVKLLKEHGFAVGLQLMPGLPGDTAEDFIEKTIDSIIDIEPDFVRLYPLLVIKGTPLENLHRNGFYRPLTLDEAVALCYEAMRKLEHAGIDVIRIGLQSTEELERPGTILAGPFHPAFRQLVDSMFFLETMRSILRERKGTNNSAVFLVNPRDVSNAIGQRRCNIKALREEFRLSKVYVVGNRDVQGRRGLKLSTS